MGAETPDLRQPDGRYFFPPSRSYEADLGTRLYGNRPLGLQTAAGPEVDQFRAWATSPDITQDVRMMVPVFFDIERKRMKVWAILGWATRALEVSFSTPPRAHVVRGQLRLSFGSTLRRIAYPVFAERYVTRLRDRDEFRAHCDRSKTRSRILQQL